MADDERDGVGDVRDDGGEAKAVAKRRTVQEWLDALDRLLRDEKHPGAERVCGDCRKLVVDCAGCRRALHADLAVAFEGDARADAALLVCPFCSSPLLYRSSTRSTYRLRHDIALELFDEDTLDALADDMQRIQHGHLLRLGFTHEQLLGLGRDQELTLVYMLTALARTKNGDQFFGDSHESIVDRTRHADVRVTFTDLERAAIERHRGTDLDSN